MIKFYNSLSRKKEIFRPRKAPKINLYVCGPTVYDFSHLGHARTYIVFDAIVRYLKSKDFEISYLQNITDIDDKIIKRAKEKKILPQKLAKDFERAYFQDMKALGINSVTKYARATEHIKEIISQIERLLIKGIAYKIQDGIYYDIKKFKDYGKLSRRTVLQAEDAVSRIDDSKGKRNKGDFCLWKFSPYHPAKAGATGQAKVGEPKWQSPFGKGRPGWHIEDTAITEKYFGPQYDLHGGGRDLIFPHHEAEIAQMEAISNKKPMVKYWLHPGFLTVEGRKMAKSLGNFVTIGDFLKNYSPRVLWLFFLKSHYHSPINYSKKAISQTEKELERIDEFVDKLKEVKSGKQKSKLTEPLILRTKRGFEEAMADDFNTPKALASIFKLVNLGNLLLSKGKITKEETKDILEFLKGADQIFNFIFWQKPKKREIPSNILKLVKEREKYRKKGDYKKSDEIRNKIKEKGWWVEDTKEGPKIKRL